MAYSSLSTRQWRWLKECLEDNKNTLYGKKYHFATISSMQMYQKTAPLTRYEDMKQYVDLISEGKEDILFAGSAVAFEMTSGSTGGSKLIPYTHKSFRDFQRAILPYLEQTLRLYHIDSKNSYWSISPVSRTIKKTKSGVVIGVSDSDYLGMEQKSVSIVPYWVADLKDIKNWKLATLYWLVSAKNLEFISIWSPTFLLVLLESMSEYRAELIDLFQSGGEISGHKVLSNPNALKNFLNYLEKKDTKALWQNLKLISLWQDGSSAPYAKKLQRLFPAVHFQSKGLLGTEGIVSIPDEQDLPILSADSGFYEFVNRDEEVLFSHQLKDGEEYEVAMTTNGGLYRYCTGDIVLCEGYRDEKPILRFSHRKGIVSDLVGEKLTEGFVANILDDSSGFVMLVPHADALHYCLVIEKNSDISKETIENRLLKNPQYSYARELGQLGDLEIIEMQNPIKVYMDKMLSDGRRIGDIKIPLLCQNDRWLR
ncbi:MAG: GH3 auxin-responsive promoter family protein [Campylobacterota bacterium]|nr:GH3 auxin-responsive promoter family protein [Campylobacterota bacterium]